MDYLTNLTGLYIDAAPWLLLGLLAAGLIKAWLPEEILFRWLGGEGLWSITKAALLGAPLPLCSCGILPAALGIRRAGASKASTLSFMIATPETGPDSIAISYAMLGPFMAILRPIAAIISAIFTGLLGLLIRDNTPETVENKPTEACSSCCSDSCQTVDKPEAGTLARTIGGLSYAFSDILDDLVLWLGIGLLLAALVATLVPPLAMAEWGSGLSAKLLMLLVGIPMYVCATASTPIAAGLLLAGISPGTVLVFLLAGPATNIATIAVVQREMGNNTMMAYLLGISVTSISLGIATDWMTEILEIDIMAQLASSTELIPIWIGTLSAILLIVMSIKPVRRLVWRFSGIG
ncbi:MAG: SO_0444 family Cu/Zn efflux transporter [Gammaproteobacteria bacterium]|nr:SO_0444 family Cu/Zn efflux transporter [Gammaproteobacteria bacterium]